MASESWQEIRPASAVIIPVVAWALLGFGAVDIAWHGTPGERLAYLPWLAVAAVAVHLVLWAPRIRVGRDAVEVREVLRTFTLPYAAISDITASGILKISYLDAAGRPRLLRPWNSPSPRKLGRPQPGAPRGGGPGRAAGSGSEAPRAGAAPEQVLLDRWRDHAGGAGAAALAVRWHAIELGVLAVLVTAAALL